MQGGQARIIPVIHNVSSVQKVVDMARVVISLDLDLLVATKVYGAAAQSGVPEAYRMLAKEGKGFVILPDLKDAVELYSPKTVLIVDRDRAAELVDPSTVPRVEGTTMVVVNGSDTSFSPQELAVGRPVYIRGLRSRAGSIAEAFTVLYLLKYYAATK